MDTSMEGLSLSTQNNYTYQNHTRMDLSTAQPVQPKLWQPNHWKGGGVQAFRFENKSQLTCFKCLNKGHSVRECQIADNKLEAVRQLNLARLTSAEGPPGGAVCSVQEGEYSGPAAYLTKIEQMQHAFETLNHEDSDFQ
ncbi:MAG: hypothetical protein GY696_01405 [Gammaproteobacteria bacterium]|nr:hypothetical protein [Gammaproteobacteria bacterium]